MRVLPLALVLLFSACTLASTDIDPGTEMPTPDPDPDSDPGSDPDPDPGSDPDPDPDPDPTDECPPSDLGYLGTIADGTAWILPIDEGEPDGARKRLYWGDIDASMELHISLWEGSGSFEDAPVAPGSYTVGADLATCGVCVQLTVATGDVVRTMLATDGILELVSVDQELVGSGNPLHLEEVGSTGLPVPGGCQTVIQQVTFDAVLEEM